jgi:glutamate synthase domain-containing protein 1
MGHNMCGIAGFLSKQDQPQPVGRIMMSMLGSLARRGPDSAGVALFRSEAAHRQTCWIRLPEGQDAAAREGAILANLAMVTDVGPVERHDALLRVELGRAVTPDEVRVAIEGESDAEVVSLGSQLELLKQVGFPDDLDRTFNISDFRGSHAIGHTRLSTESRVDLSHSQPFWAHGVADLATVHNGHITNYDKLRRIYEQRGVRFFSHNDSEVIGVYLAEQVHLGLTLEQALEASLDDFDGSFTYLVATGDAIGYARDPFALKPLITVETPDYVAIANEEIAIRAALGSDGVAHEPSGHVFRTWRRGQLPATAAA